MWDKIEGKGWVNSLSPTNNSQSHKLQEALLGENYITRKYAWSLVASDKKVRISFPWEV